MPYANNDPFYSQSNISYLKKIAKQIEDGTANLAEHDLIEISDSGIAGAVLEADRITCNTDTKR